MYPKWNELRHDNGRHEPRKKQARKLSDYQFTNSPLLCSANVVCPLSKSIGPKVNVLISNAKWTRFVLRRLFNAASVMVVGWCAAHGDIKCRWTSTLWHFDLKWPNSLGTWMSVAAAMTDAITYIINSRTKVSTGFLRRLLFVYKILIAAHSAQHTRSDRAQACVKLNHQKCVH